MTGEWYWHVHHDQLVEQLTEPLQNRLEYIKANKPEDEIETRLRLLKPALGVAPAWEQYKKVKASALEQYKKVEASAWEQYKKVKASAWEQYEKVEASAWEQYEKVEASALEQYKKVEAPALEQYEKVEASALEQYKKVVNQLHAEQCPNCPWNGSTIFP
jgi:hypothetical protein